MFGSGFNNYYYYYYFFNVLSDNIIYLLYIYFLRSNINNSLNLFYVTVNIK